MDNIPDPNCGKCCGSGEIIISGGWCGSEDASIGENTLHAPCDCEDPRPYKLERRSLERAIRTKVQDLLSFSARMSMQGSFQRVAGELLPLLAEACSDTPAFADQFSLRFAGLRATYADLGAPAAVTDNATRSYLDTARQFARELHDLVMVRFPFELKMGITIDEFFRQSLETPQYDGWMLWLDDDAGKEGMETFRNPPTNEEGWYVAHSSKEAIHLIGAFGVPSFISFDHDLGVKSDGTEDTAMLVIDYLTDHYYEADINYEVHSKNPIGKMNIISKMESWKKSKSL